MFRKMLASMAVLAGLMAAPPPAAAQDAVKFGFMAPLTGQFSANGQRFREAVELFVEQTNAAGGVSGRMLEVDYQDDRGDPLQAANLAQRFAADEDVVAVIGSFTSTASIAAGQVLAEAGVPQVSPTSSHPDFTKISNWQFRMPNTQDVVAVLNADLIVNKLGAKTVAIPYFQDDWGIFVQEATRAEVEKLGGEVVLAEAMTPQARDFRSLVTKIRALQPDAVFIASHYQPSAVFMQQLRQAGVDVPVGAADPLYNPEFVKLAGDAAEGIITTTYYFPDDPSKATFTDGYAAKYGRRPDQWAAFAYDAVAIATAGVAAVLDSGEPLTRAAVRDAIDALPPFEGATGVTDFVDGTPRKPMTLLRIEGGDYVLHE